ncbi:hypothetical protein ES319_D06G212400v1 [Gossypium barbadense]|uniref:Uncharacterized protein n=1 Tax=Gossypium barbadense TaxID=3634 RepID=A0A5J5R610_GOSBA|nr:hypothetical protein ES319_D06G212400v1 [Gossypium barbadense]
MYEAEERSIVVFDVVITSSINDTLGHCLVASFNIIFSIKQGFLLNDLTLGYTIFNNYYRKFQGLLRPILKERIHNHEAENLQQPAVIFPNSLYQL